MSHLPTDPENFKLPDALTPLRKMQRWLVWKWQERNDGKRSKPPIDRDGYVIDGTDPANWLPYTVALARWSTGGLVDGIGFALHGSRAGRARSRPCVRGRVPGCRGHASWCGRPGAIPK
jgi:hypothetical protein